ncbi:hypothetical protein HFK89_03710 [Ralstonia pseudosolanacearum]|uniref:hypothetical protein n=1 Tax=Ralstonia pseudosolanacearum TaxID=1310165 RepID=UPI00147DADE0|nr:hypothetical protein [Ralstonia pseudosolanacearum]MCK4161572.1 hypothetical protein [Ralstonia pseudosolanacearum]
MDEDQARALLAGPFGIELAASAKLRSSAFHRDAETMSRQTTLYERAGCSSGNLGK